MEFLEKLNSLNGVERLNVKGFEGLCAFSTNSLESAYNVVEVFALDALNSGYLIYKMLNPKLVNMYCPEFDSHGFKNGYFEVYRFKSNDVIPNYIKMRIHDCPSSLMRFVNEIFIIQEFFYKSIDLTFEGELMISCKFVRPMLSQNILNIIDLIQSYQIDSYGKSESRSVIKEMLMLNNGFCLAPG